MSRINFSRIKNFQLSPPIADSCECTKDSCPPNIPSPMLTFIILFMLVCIRVDDADAPDSKIEQNTS